MVSVERERRGAHETGAGRSALSNLHDAAVIGTASRTYPGARRARITWHAQQTTRPWLSCCLLRREDRVQRPSHAASLAHDAFHDPGEKRRPSPTRTTITRDDKCVSNPGAGYMPGEGTTREIERETRSTWRDRSILRGSVEIPGLKRPPADPVNPCTRRFRECKQRLYGGYPGDAIFRDSVNAGGYENVRYHKSHVHLIYCDNINPKCKLTSHDCFAPKCEIFTYSRCVFIIGAPRLI